MARKEDLRVQRADTVINTRSKRQEKALNQALRIVEVKLKRKFPRIKLDHVSEWKLKDVVARLRGTFPAVDFHYFFESSAMRPDGGIMSIVDNDGAKYPILIAEKKNQGTNDLRALEGKTKQARGNAIERLGKNVIGFRTAMNDESIFPFVCFGDGCDFVDDSSILDRVVTIAQFGKLNVEHLHKQGSNNEFDRGTFYFRCKEWSESEMAKLSFKLAEKSIYYYFSKYGEDAFR
ncbi:MAG: EcoRI family type II restriction endonuclease [Rhodanobacter sp.]